MKRITRFKKRTWVLLGVVAVIAAMASVGAYAFWTSSGTGQGSATTGTSTAWTGHLRRGHRFERAHAGRDPFKTVAYRVKNNSSGVQALFKVNFQIATSNNADPASTPGVSTASIAALKPDCTKNDFELSLMARPHVGGGWSRDRRHELAGDVAASAPHCGRNGPDPDDQQAVKRRRCEQPGQLQVSDRPLFLTAS